VVLKLSGMLLASQAQASAAVMGSEIAALERELAEFNRLKRRRLFRTTLRIVALRHRRPFRYLLAAPPLFQGSRA
jgi:hypothetical protein